MKSPNACNETVHSNSSNQPGSAENSHSPSVQYETVARHQQYESIVDTGYEQLTAQYEAAHNTTLEHTGYEEVTHVNQHDGQPTLNRWVNNVDEDGYWQVLDVQATQGVQLEYRPPANHWVNNADEDGYWQVLNDEQRVPLDAEGYSQVQNNVELTQSAGCNQQVRQQASSVDINGYLQPAVVNNDAGVRVLPTVNLNIVAAAASNAGNQLNLMCATHDQSETPPNPLYTAQDQDDTPPNPLYTAQDQEDTPPNPLYTAQDQE
jgi:hypothetical protein